MSAVIAVSPARSAPWQIRRAACCLPVALEAVAMPIAGRPWRSPAGLEDTDRSMRARSTALLEGIIPQDIETLILDRCAREVAAEAGHGASVVELGSGSPAKTLRLLGALEGPAAYRAIDRSARALAHAAAAIRTRFAALPVATVQADFSEVDAVLARLSNDRGSGRTLLFLPAARIGRLAPEAAVAFLRRIGASAGGHAVLVVGADGDGASSASRGAAGPSLCLDHARSTHATGGRPYSLARFEALIRSTGWQHAQFWTDGQARFGVHVLTRV